MEKRYYAPTKHVKDKKTGEMKEVSTGDSFVRIPKSVAKTLEWDHDDPVILKIHVVNDIVGIFIHKKKRE